MTKKRNGFLRFCCSLLPGAGEMYMGFMKMGLSLMSMFFGIIVAASIFELGPLAVLAVIAWFYSFFHVHNLAGLSDEEFYAVEDDYLFHLSGEGGKDKSFVKRYCTIISPVRGGFSRAEPAKKLLALRGDSPLRGEMSRSDRGVRVRRTGRACEAGGALAPFRRLPFLLLSSRRK